VTAFDTMHGSAERRLVDGCARAAEQLRLENQALRELHRMLADCLAQNLALHRQNAQLIRRINLELESLKRRLRRINTART